jgi:hypothetical protein
LNEFLFHTSSIKGLKGQHICLDQQAPITQI